MLSSVSALLEELFISRVLDCGRSAGPDMALRRFILDLVLTSKIHEIIMSSTVLSEAVAVAVAVAAVVFVFISTPSDPRVGEFILNTR